MYSFDRHSRSEALARILFTPERWVHRRVEAIEFLTNGETRRTVSLDITLDRLCTLRASRGRMIVPIGFLAKEPLRKLSTFGVDGSPLCVLNTGENAAISTAMLVRLSRRVMPDLDRGTAGCLERSLASIADSDVESASHCAAEVIDWVEAKYGPDLPDGLRLYTELLRGFAENFVLMVEVPSAWRGTRTIIKFSYEKRLPIPDGIKLPFVLGIPGPQLWMSRSCHIEVRTPPGAQIAGVRVDEMPNGGSWADAGSTESDAILGPGHIAHVVCHRETALADAETQITFQPDHRSLTMAALAATWLSSIALFLPPIAAFVEAKYDLGLFDRGLSEGVALLLIGPAALAAYFGRAPEHPLVARVLWPLRCAILLTVALLLVAAAIVATRLDLPGPDWPSWAVLGVIQFAIALHVTKLWLRIRSLA